MAEPNYTIVDKLLQSKADKYLIDETDKAIERDNLAIEMTKNPNYRAPLELINTNITIDKLDNINTFNNKDLLNNIYQDVGGVDKMFQERKKNRLNIEYDPTQFDKILQNNHVDYNKNNDIKLNMKDLGYNKYGLYNQNEITIYPYYKVSPFTSNVFLHELTHSFQGDYIGALTDINKDKIKKGISINYWDNQNEIEARASGYLHDWQRKNNKILLTPKDLEDLINNTKWDSYDNTDEMKKIFKTIIPTVASNKLAPYMENLG